MNEDAVLIDAARGGDVAAFEQLVRKYQDRLFNTINMIHTTDYSHDAEDVVQETFVQAYLKLHTFQGRSAFYTWIYRIAYNLLIARRRRKRAEGSIELRRELAGEEPQCRQATPAAQLQADETVGEVQSALNSLPQDYRAILVLREMEGCDYDTIADILQLPIGTVRSRLHRARSQLRDQMRRVYDETLAN